MTNQNIAERMAEKVSKAIVNAGKSKLQVSNETGIPYPTLNRKLRGRYEFSMTELLILAENLGVHPSEFIPEQFQSKQVA